MGEIKRCDVNDEWAHSGYVVAGDYIFLGYCVGNVGESVEAQINGAFDDMARKLQMEGLTLDSVVKIDVLFRDVWNIPLLEKVMKERFTNGYPARKTISTDFAHQGGESGLHVQIDGIAYKKGK
ncbi:MULTISPECIES: RidA family protein [unclassified Agarivorans]|uniref:RidA family protein n=1 Tax=unclassified Agarivorans TaxID=2636026 RepID=UPI0026E17118|nr:MULTISPECIES: RidA family protein [unclassified Agarivorans]MDO6687644.1 RidA family protein [Agarivorans sp. 3_MG-2023]MDO6717198.1 RidA family protein [Agarivorans sp. 2_MG-2023]